MNTTVKPQHTRNQFDLADKLLGHFPCISLVGARQTGKTTLARQLRPDWKYLDLENPNDFELISRDPVLFFQQFSSNIIIDEAQLYPELFNVLRGVIDANRDQKNRFILTGSSSSKLLTNISESLAGRVATLEIGTLKANEFYQTPLSPFYNMFQQKLARNNMPSGSPSLSNQDMHLLWLKGGYPEPLLSEDSFFYNQWMTNYFANYINRDIAMLFPRLERHKYQKFIKILSKLSSTIINKSELGRTLEISESSAREYLKIAEGTFLWRELLSWEANVIKSVIKMPKGYIRDTGLLHYLSNIQELDDLYTSPIVGQSFEAFVIEELLKGLNATELTNWRYHYYRTRRGVEVDLVLSGSFGTLPIEIKYGSKISKRNLTNLTHFIETQNLPFGLVINQGDEAMWLTDKIYQLPICWL